jgi:hypothetical protein
MTADVFIGWAIRIVLAILAFVVVRWLLPVLLALGGIDLPDNIVLLLAILVALLVLAGGWYWYGRRGPVVP